MDATTITTWMNEVAGAVRAERDYLIQLDAAIGDGDHGINMTRGFDAVVRALAQEEDGSPGKLLTLAGKTLVSSVGGASGPLWGSALRRGGRALGDAPTFDAERLVEALEAALASIVDLGAAVPGDKTMVDALQPAVTTLRREVESGTASAGAVGGVGDLVSSRIQPLELPTRGSATDTSPSVDGGPEVPFSNGRHDFADLARARARCLFEVLDD